MSSLKSVPTLTLIVSKPAAISSAAAAGAFRLVGSHRKAAAHGQWSHRPAEQFVNRLPQLLAADIPARHFERRLGEPIVLGRLVHHGGDGIDIGRIAADQLRSEHAIDQSLRAPDGFTAPPRQHGRFASPFDPRIGRDSDEHVVRDVVLPEGGDHPPLGLERNLTGKVSIRVIFMTCRLPRIGGQRRSPEMRQRAPVFNGGEPAD